MNYKFQFKGGVYNTERMNIKLLVFIVVGGKEIAFHNALGYSMIIPEAQSECYETEHSIIKIFYSEYNFGCRKIFYPFYIMMGNSVSATKINIKPIQPECRANEWRFETFGRFLSKKEAYDLIFKSKVSQKILATTQMPPVEFLRKIITIEQPMEAKKEKDDIRHIRKKGVGK